MQCNHRLLHTRVQFLNVWLTLLTAGTSANNISTSSAMLSRQEVEPKESGKNIYDIIPKGYIVHEPPPLLDGKPIPVDVSVKVFNIPNLDEIKQEVSLEMNLRFYWVDTRLDLSEFKKKFPSKNFLNLNPLTVTKIWAPDIVTEYTKNVNLPKILTLAAGLRVYSNHTLRYSVRLIMEQSCLMDFRMFPADTQNCELSFRTYAFSRDRVTFAWRNDGDNIGITHRLKHFDFNVTFYEDVGTATDTAIPIVRMKLWLVRRLTYHLMQTYLPSMMFVFVSWFSFLVAPETVPARMALCMTTLLTLTAMFAAVRQSTPSVSYVKALDIWMVACIFFVFLALVEYTMVLRLVDNHKKSKPHTPKKIRSLRKISKSGFFKIAGELPTKPARSPGCWNLLYWWKNPTLRGIAILEKVTSICIPIAFFIFNILYWPWLLNGGKLPLVME